MQSVYDDIFLIDFEKNSCRELYHRDGHFAPLPSGLPLADTLQHDIAERIHPDDAQRVAALFTQENLRQRLTLTPIFAAEDARKKVSPVRTAGCALSHFHYQNTARKPISSAPKTLKTTRLRPILPMKTKCCAGKSWMPCVTRQWWTTPAPWFLNGAAQI
ncbi:MAG: hypothetical protein QM665_10445 [Desulfovibrio sp.]